MHNETGTTNVYLAANSCQWVFQQIQKLSPSKDFAKHYQAVLLSLNRANLFI